MHRAGNYRQAPARLSAPRIEEIKLLVTLLASSFSTLELGLQVCQLLGFRGYISSLASKFPVLLPLPKLGNNVQLQRLLSQLAKALCLSEIATEAPFPSPVSRTPLSVVLFLLVMFRTPDNLIKPGSGPLPELVRQVSLLLLASFIKFFVRL